MKTKFDQLHRELNQDIQQVSSRVDTIELKVDQLSQNDWFSPDRTLVVSRLNTDTSRSEFDQAQALVKDGLGLDTPVVRIKRMAGRNGRPGLLKVELPSVNEKIEALRRKQNLRSRARYEHVYIRSSQTHDERVAQGNIRTLLDSLPDLRGRYRFAGNGRLVEKTERVVNGRPPDNQQAADRTMMHQSTHGSVPRSTPGQNINLPIDPMMINHSGPAAPLQHIVPELGGFYLPFRGQKV